MASTDVLDHIVYLVPPGSLKEAMKGFADLGFNVIPGGTHTGGETENALILFEEGPYIEIISFVKPPPPDTRHRWAKERPGWVDWALLGPSDETNLAHILNRRSSNLYHYEPTTPGGRERPDGKVLKWRITAPSPVHKPGVLPFFCGDVTPRKWRVPLDGEGNARHANGGVGVSWVRALSNAASQVHKQLDNVLKQQVDVESPWLLQTTGKEETAFLIVAEPQIDRERTFLQRKDRETALYEIGIRLSGGRGPGAGVHDLEFGRLVFESKST